MSVLHPKADIIRLLGDVRFVPICDILRRSKRRAIRSTRRRGWPAKLITKDEPRRMCGEYRQATGLTPTNPTASQFSELTRAPKK
jgi:hypothetical protein